MVQYRRLVPSALSPGTLYLVSTPIGNLEDITYRAVRVLGAVDAIAAEDTRRAAKLCAHYGITTRRISLHEHNEASRVPSILARLGRGETVAVVSDAGTPLVSDPGRRVTQAALEAGYRVEPIPGPSAVLAALTASGFVSDEGFVFVGFPPRRSKDRKRWFEAVVASMRPVVFFEAPHRINRALADLKSMAADRRVAVCRELTKIHEELVICPIKELPERFEPERGEFTVVVEAAPGTRRAPAGSRTESVAEEFGRLTSSGRTRREAIREIASNRGLASRDVYREIERIKALSSVN